MHDCAIRVACDVTNPLTGDTGASEDIWSAERGYRSDDPRAGQ
ncbi:glycerate kinase [Escherichia coli]